MRRLDRSRIRVPDDWDDVVADKLPDAAAYFRKAAAFEVLDINDPVRRKSFTKYAPEVLKLSGRRRVFPAVWSSDKRVKDAMKELSHHKCVYCETPINARRSMQVEHFRPKSLFPSLTYDWDNYFLACNGCNGAKSNKWPRTGGYVRPDENEPETLFVFDVAGRVKAVDTDTDAKQTVKDFALDRPGLRHMRKLAIKETLADLKDMKDVLAATGVGGADRLMRRLVRNKLARIKEPETRFSVAQIQNIQQWWKDNFPALAFNLSGHSG